VSVTIENLVIENQKMLIGGEWIDADSGRTFETVNPATEELIANVPRASAIDVDRAVSVARETFETTWRKVQPRDRARLLFEVARALRERVEEFAQLETLDQGKPLPDGRKGVLSAARYFEFYAGAADKIYGETIPLGPGYVDFTVREPRGVTAHIVPWNFPIDLAARSVAPALAAGNTCVVKPAEQTPLTALKLGELLEELGLPAGAYNVVTGFGDEAGAPLCEHPDVDSVTFTGSVETGRRVMRACAEHITPVVLELGGKSPNVIFGDADLDLAVEEAARGIYFNSGQVCSAGSRLVVEAGVKDELLDRLVERSKKIEVGPGNQSPDIGPLVSDEQFERVMGYIHEGEREGAKLIYGGTRPDHLDKGYFVSPTIFDGVQNEMRIAQEEIFGPVLSVLTFKDDAEAVRIANDVKFGLVAGIFTKDIDRALALASEIRAGQIFINEYFAGGEETPFGGYKQSGFGREKGLEGLLNYTQTKNVAVRIHSDLVSGESHTSGE
jgi:aldehyde dehydrogenase (NAD+)